MDEEYVDQLLPWIPGRTGRGLLVDLGGRDRLVLWAGREGPLVVAVSLRLSGGPRSILAALEVEPDGHFAFGRTPRGMAREQMEQRIIALDDRLRPTRGRLNGVV